MTALSIADLANVTGGAAGAPQGIRPPFIGGFQGSDADVWSQMGKGSAPAKGPQGIRPPFIGGTQGSDVDVWSRMRCGCGR